MNQDLHIFGLTGGIATGKSTFIAFLKKRCPEAVVFDSDLCVADLYRDVEVLAAIKKYFGPDVILGDEVNKSFLRQRVFTNSEDKLFMENLFHPRVREECLALLVETTKRNASRLFVADVPLLFENGFDFGQSANLLVATSRKTQIDRLKKRNVWQDGMAETVIASQMNIEAKLPLADMVFWNEGTVDVLQLQCDRFLESLV